MKRKFQTDIGKKIRKIREDKGITISELEKLTGLSKSYISQLECGIVANPTIAVLNKIVRSLETSISELLVENLATNKNLLINLDNIYKNIDYLINSLGDEQYRMLAKEYDDKSNIKEITSEKKISLICRFIEEYYLKKREVDNFLEKFKIL